MLLLLTTATTTTTYTTTTTAYAYAYAYSANASARDPAGLASGTNTRRGGLIGVRIPTAPGKQFIYRFIFIISHVFINDKQAWVMNGVIFPITLTIRTR